jgi:Tol biopolymer transport system component
LILLTACKSTDSKQIDLSLSQTPGEVELFGRDLVSTPYYERDIAISPEGDEIVYTLGDYNQNRRCLVSIRKVSGGWTQPEMLEFSGKYKDLEPFITPDGNRLFFVSDRPVFGDSTRHDFNIWYAERQGNSWGEPMALDTIINTPGQEYYPSVSEAGNLYFTAAKKGGPGLEDIYMSAYSDGSFQTPVALSEAVNSAFYEFNAYISPDENLIVFSSYGREDGFGGGDLYFSRKDEDGIWRQAENMGEAINSEKIDFCPFIDWTNMNFYFTSERSSPVDPELNSVDELKDLSNRVENGFGNIYRIGIEYTGIN